MTPAAGSPAAAASAQPAAAPEPRLQGDLLMWAVIGIEMLTFGLLFATFAVARRFDPALFAAGQAGLNLHLGAVNTALLLGGSWAVVRALAAMHAAPSGDATAALRQARRAAAWTWGAVACGAVFVAAKLHEYAAKFAQGADLDSDTFHTLYFLLTGFHLMHVLAATVVLAVIAWRAPRRRWGPGDTHAPETAAAFWHMIDLLWVVLFPLVYVLGRVA